MKNSYWPVLLPLLFALSCNSSRITSSWKNSQMSAGPFHKILVVSLVSEPEYGMKQIMEKHLVEDLKSKGLEAISAFDLYGPHAFDGLSEKAVIDNIRNSGVDAILTIVLLDKERERYYVPGRVQFTPYIVYHRHFWGYYSTINSRIYTPGYYVSNTHYFWESNLYEASGGNLIYSAQTKSFDPSSTETLSHEYGQLIIADLMKYQLLRLR
jgi:hypothetical protein